MRLKVIIECDRCCTSTTTGTMTEKYSHGFVAGLDAYPDAEGWTENKKHGEWYCAECSQERPE